MSDNLGPSIDPSRDSSQWIARFTAEGAGVSSFSLKLGDRLHYGHALSVGNQSVLVISTAEGIAYHKAIVIDDLPLWAPVHHQCGAIIVEIDPKTALITGIFEETKIIGGTVYT